MTENVNSGQKLVKKVKIGRHIPHADRIEDITSKFQSFIPKNVGDIFY